MSTTEQRLLDLGACQGAIQYAVTQPDALAVIKNCPQVEWLGWLDNKCNILTDKERRLLACWCVRNTPLADGRKVWHLLADQRSRNAVEVAEKYANGEATDDELTAARDAAWDAWDARDAAWVARDAARVAWDAAWDAQRAYIFERYGERFAKVLTQP